jgi:hypothetical protein
MSEKVRSKCQQRWMANCVRSKLLEEERRHQSQVARIFNALSQSSLKSLFKSSSGFEKKHQMFWQLCLFAQNCDLLGGNRFS